MGAPKNTEPLYARIEDAAATIKRIEAARGEALDSLRATAHQLAAKVPGADVSALMDHIADGLDDMLCDVLDRYRDEAREADEEIGNLEYADLYRNSPIVI